MRQFLLLFILIPIGLFAQDDKYLQGAVPEVNGKVVFTQEIQIPGLTDSEIYNTLLKWAEERYQDDKNRVVYSDPESGNIAAIGEEYLVFSSSALALDRSLMNYRLTITTGNNNCLLSVSGIRYEYNVSYKREPEKYVAEDWITDKQAISKNKLNRMNGKFRTATIDFVDHLFQDAAQALGVANSSAPAAPAIIKEESIMVIPPKPSEMPLIITPGPVANLDGYRQIQPDRIPGNIVKMLTDDWMLITAGNDEEFNMMTASWGGLGHLYEKPVAFCFIRPDRYIYQLMEKSDTYTFTFYTEAYRETLQFCGTHSGKEKDKVKESGLTPLTTPSGSKAFGEAWMIIECRKLISQPIDPDAIHDKPTRNKQTDHPMHKMYIGEIINVWIK